MDNTETRYICALDEDFPERLRSIPDSPQGIYVKGRLPDPGKPSVSIIGSRNNSEYGRGVARYFAEVLAKNGVQIISGMARGIDGISQKAAVEAGGESFGVLGCGIDMVYPNENKDLFKKVPLQGGLISEYPPGTPPLPRLFPPRNRIISALCDILLVIEARQQSGTSITVRYALDQGKDVYAVPGRITDPLSSGCNGLIADGAGVAISPETILEALEASNTGNICIPAVRQGIRLSRAQASIMKYLDFMPLNVNELSAKTSLTIREVMTELPELEIRGLARKVSPGFYVKVF